MLKVILGTLYLAILSLWTSEITDNNVTGTAQGELGLVWYEVLAQPVKWCSMTSHR